MQPLLLVSLLVGTEKILVHLQLQERVPPRKVPKCAPLRHIAGVPTRAAVDECGCLDVRITDRILELVRACEVHPDHLHFQPGKDSESRIRERGVLHGGDGPNTRGLRGLQSLHNHDEVLAVEDLVLLVVLAEVALFHTKEAAEGIIDVAIRAVVLRGVPSGAGSQDDACVHKCDDCLHATLDKATDVDVGCATAVCQDEAAACPLIADVVCFRQRRCRAPVRQVEIETLEDWNARKHQARCPRRCSDCMAERPWPTTLT
mmetsp:Transcript_84000/g.271494  ORF Transcript_84000/g.271494 Transcript_84000/m.271494 type:complete len:260 (-) Transcript_84000:994-1773(-)